MTKPVTPQDMFDLWQKMVNPSAYPLQSLMFPVLDAKELEKKIAELEAVEHWLRANLNMLGLTIKSLQFQRQMVKGGERARTEMGDDLSGAGDDPLNPAMWALNLMAKACSPAAEPMDGAVEAADEIRAKAARNDSRPKPKARKKKAKR